MHARKLRYHPDLKQQEGGVLFFSFTFKDARYISRHDALLESLTPNSAKKICNLFTLTDAIVLPFITYMLLIHGFRPDAFRSLTRFQKSKPMKTILKVRVALTQMMMFEVSGIYNTLCAMSIIRSCTCIKHTLPLSQLSFTNSSLPRIPSI